MGIVCYSDVGSNNSASALLHFIRVSSTISFFIAYERINVDNSYCCFDHLTSKCCVQAVKNI